MTTTVNNSGTPAPDQHSITVRASFQGFEGCGLSEIEVSYYGDGLPTSEFAAGVIAALADVAAAAKYTSPVRFMPPPSPQPGTAPKHTIPADAK